MFHNQLRKERNPKIFYNFLVQTAGHSPVKLNFSSFLAIIKRVNGHSRFNSLRHSRNVMDKELDLAFSSNNSIKVTTTTPFGMIILVPFVLL